MKTAISIPDDVFAKAEQMARTKGMSRSQFFTKAVEYFIESGADDPALEIKQINQVIDELGVEAFGISDELSQAQTNLLGDEQW